MKEKHGSGEREKNEIKTQRRKKYENTAYANFFSAFLKSEIAFMSCVQCGRERQQYSLLLVWKFFSNEKST